ncbi:transglutaminase family protein [soil metagenome]
MENMEEYLKPTQFVDSDNPAIIAFAHEVVGESTDAVEQVVKLYYAVRDRFPYNPYEVDLSNHGLKASTALNRGYGYCVEKANIMAASARALGIPSRFGFADVRNHIGSGKLMQVLRTNLLAFHGYVELYVNGKWVKATPAFNKTLCEKLQVQPLEFNGLEDSIFQENDGPDGKFMEYVFDHGTFADIPQEYMIEVLRNHYPHLFAEDAAIATEGMAMFKM